MKTILYFAYGSNMNQDRMKERNCNFNSAEKAYLNNYILKFNKRSIKNPDVGFANVIEQKNSIVEGILYEVDENKILSLDKFEGHPKHYLRTEIDIVKEDKSIVKANIYIAQEKWIGENLKPSQEYLNLLISGKDFLTESYYQKLKNTQTI